MICQSVNVNGFTFNFISDEDEATTSARTRKRHMEKINLRAKVRRTGYDTNAGAPPVANPRMRNVNLALFQPIRKTGGDPMLSESYQAVKRVHRDLPKFPSG